MAHRVRVWFDAEADFLEVRFSDAAGYEKETEHDAVMERVDAKGEVIGFSIMGVSKFRKDKPLEADLLPGLSLPKGDTGIPACSLGEGTAKA